MTKGSSRPVRRPVQYFKQLALSCLQRRILTHNELLVNTAVFFHAHLTPLASSAAHAALSLGLLAAILMPRWPFIEFSRPFQTLDPRQTTDTIADPGWEGIQCPVRGC